MTTSWEEWAPILDEAGRLYELGDAAFERGDDALATSYWDMADETSAPVEHAMSGLVADAARERG